ncbi:MAG: hypothetical protein JXQ90_17640 [Cyclobacteriaceae bacterium]
MKEDIKFLPVEGVYLTVAMETDGGWKVYLINRNSQHLSNVMVTSKGYGDKEGAKQKTSVLRHMFPLVESGEYALIEPIDKSVFHLTNEYWVSFFIDKQVYDKKYLFVPDSITEENLSYIPEINLHGVLHE